MLQRKGQLTLFIILGILLLFFVVGYIYLQGRTEDLETNVPTVKTVPLELQPINAYVETCLAQVAVDGLKRLGERGGYIEPRSWGFDTNPTEPTEADAVEFLPGTDLVVPYWFYMRSKNDCFGHCEYSYNRPNLYSSQGEPSIEGQLDEYVNENLPSCLTDFSYFRDQGFSVKAVGEVQTRTNVYEEDVAFYVEYPLQFSIDGRVHTIDEFFIRVPLKLKSVYEQASLITNLQSQYQFLERDLLNLIVGYSGVDSSKLPPMSATDFEFGGGEMWSKFVVKERVEEILSSYIPALQVFGSRNYRPVSFTGNAFRETLYNSGMLVISEQVFPHLAVSFNYLDFWPIYFELNCEGDVCRPESASSNLIALIGVQRYNFLYDVSYPALVAISDPNALNHRGYEFQFLLEANIRDNRPLNSSYVPVVSTLGVEASMLCDLNKRNSGNITIAVNNAFNSEPIDEVEVAYTCVEESCSVGETKEGILQTQFPICMGGIVSFLKEGFLGSSRWLSTELEKEDSLEVELMPLKPVEFSVEKYQLVKSGKWVLRDNTVPLEDTEWVIVSLKRVSDLGEGDHSVLKQFFGNETNPSIELAPGEYVVRMQLMLDEEIVLHPKERCFDGGWFSDDECVWIPEETMILDKPFMTGGLDMNYTFTVDDLSKSHVTFYVISVEIDDIPESQRVIEDLEPPGRISEYSYAYREKLRPQFG